MSLMHSPIHPGEVLLEDYLKPMGMSVRAVSIALRIPYSRLRAIVSGTREVSADTALRLERYFGSEAQGWLAMQAAYDLRIVEQQSGEQIKRDISPIQHNVQTLKGKFQKPEHPVSIEVMNTAIASRGANAALRPMHNAPHPGEVLREYLGDLSIEAASEKLGLDHEVLSGLLAGSVPISLETAHRLSLALATSQEMWIGIQSQYDLTLNVG